jgi:hypothetical protein
MGSASDQPNDDPYDLILHVGKEGGSLRLLATRQVTPLYAAFTTDQTLAWIEEGPEINTHTPWGKWADTLKLIDRYQWPRLYPKFVNPNYASRIWPLLEKAWPDIREHKREEWALLCGQDAENPVFDTSPLKRGERVLHAGAPQWGIGSVLEESDGLKAHVFFELAGEKTLSLEHAKLQRVMGAAASSLMLDNLHVDKGRPSVNYKSVPASIAFFMREFPGGFEGERYKFHEGDHKRLIHADAMDMLGEAALRELLDAGNFDEVCKRAFRLTAARQNAMIFSHEKMALSNGLRDPARHKPFAEALFDVLYGEGEFSPRFQAWANQLEDLGAAKWTVATYFLFFVHPDRHMFVKPTITQYAADVCAFDINYRPELNAKTYSAVLKFSEFLKQATAELGPKDMIDVQSFMWCIAPGTYAGEA